MVGLGAIVCLSRWLMINTESFLHEFLRKSQMNAWESVKSDLVSGGDIDGGKYTPSGEKL